MYRSRRRRLNSRRQLKKKKQRRTARRPQQSGGGDTRRNTGGGSSPNNSREDFNAYIPLTTVAGKHCAPARDGTFTCYTRDELAHMADKTGATYTPRTTKRQLWNLLDTKFENKCADEHCWASQVAGTAGLTHHAFRPPMSRRMKQNSHEWLSTTDIEAVMRQYEAADPSYRFVGAVPLDFDSSYDRRVRHDTTCISQELCDMDLLEWWRKGVRKVGIVFNMDPHDMSGSHWVALHCGLDLNAVYYYDSYGFYPPAEIGALAKRMAEQARSIHTQPMRVVYNDIRHQFRNTECGVYAMYFLMHMARGMPFETFLEDNNLSDTQINKYRNYFYNSFA